MSPPPHPSQVQEARSRIVGSDGRRGAAARHRRRPDRDAHPACSGLARLRGPARQPVAPEGEEGGHGPPPPPRGDDGGALVDPENLHAAQPADEGGVRQAHGPEQARGPGLEGQGRLRQTAVNTSLKTTPSHFSPQVEPRSELGRRRVDRPGDLQLGERWGVAHADLGPRALSRFSHGFSPDLVVPLSGQVRTSHGTFLTDDMDPVLRRITERVSHIVMLPGENQEAMQVLRRARSRGGSGHAGLQRRGFKTTSRDSHPDPRALLSLAAQVSDWAVLQAARGFLRRRGGHCSCAHDALLPERASRSLPPRGSSPPPTRPRPPRPRRAQVNKNRGGQRTMTVLMYLHVPEARCAPSRVRARRAAAPCGAPLGARGLSCREG